MAEVDVSLTVTGLRAAISEMEQIERRLTDLAPAWQVAAQLMIRFVDDRFESSTAPDGSPWAPLSDETLARRRGNTATILVDTGIMRNSVTAFGDGGELKFGTNVVYAQFHQLGTEYMEARPFFPVDLVGGQWLVVEDGPAVDLMDKIRRALESYVSTGRVTI